MAVTLTLNGARKRIDAPGDMPLLHALRDVVGLTGTKYGCGIAACGACMVLVDGVATPACATPLEAVEGQSIVTIEGLSRRELSKVQRAWAEIDVPQCGYCQSGQIIAATALLSETPNPTDADIDAQMSRNLCRCGTYPRIRAAIKRAAQL